MLHFSHHSAIPTQILRSFFIFVFFIMGLFLFLVCSDFEIVMQKYEHFLTERPLLNTPNH